MYVYIYLFINLIKFNLQYNLTNNLTMVKALWILTINNGKQINKKSTIIYISSILNCLYFIHARLIEKNISLQCFFADKTWSFIKRKCKNKVTGKNILLFFFSFACLHIRKGIFTRWKIKSVFIADEVYLTDICNRVKLKEQKNNWIYKHGWTS